MKVDLITGEEFKAFSEEIYSRLEEVSKSILQNNSANGWCSEEDAMKILKISKSTLQNYKKRKLISYSQRGRKIWIKKSDLYAFLNKNYKGNVK